MHAYGPVPSRRLGKSIGVSPIPAKVCSYSCVYCQLGRTSTLQVKRQRFFPKDDILRDVETVVKSEAADVITFAGDGEPTLCSDLGYLIRQCKKEFGLPLAVITNGSLLFDEELCSELSAADFVLPTLDAGNAEIFKKMNRPHGSITFDKMIKGITTFRELFDGQLWLEVMLVKGVNDTEKQLEMLHDAVTAIQPDKVFVVTPIRPPAEKWVECPEPERVETAQQMLSNAIALEDRENGNFGVKEFANAAEAILEISARHPLRLDQAQELEGEFGESDVVRRLIQNDKIRIKRYQQIEYIYPLKTIEKPVANTIFSTDIRVKRNSCCSYQVVLETEGQQRQFRVVLGDAYYDYLARGQISKEQLLKYCFDCFVNMRLLDRLPKKFTLKDYFQQNPRIETGFKRTIINGVAEADVN